MTKNKSPMRGYRRWKKIPNIIPVHILYMPRLRESPRFGKRVKAAIERLQNQPAEPLSLLKSAVIKQIQVTRPKARGGLFLASGSWRLGNMFDDDIARKDSEPVAGVRVAFGNFITRNDRTFELDGILGVTGFHENTQTWICIINPKYGVGPASWGLLHEMQHLLDIRSGIDLGDQTRLDIRNANDFTLYSALPEERRAEDYACTHMVRLGYVRGRKMTCDEILASLLFEEPS